MLLSDNTDLGFALVELIENSFDGLAKLILLSGLDNLLLDDFFRDAIHSSQKCWRKVVAQSVLLGVPTPCFSTALAFYDGYRYNPSLHLSYYKYPHHVFFPRSKKLPANLLQAQRDYFGAHTYELLAEPGKFVHTNWTGTGGDVSASTYSA